MARYRYKAIAANGEVVVGHLAAESREAAIRVLRERGVVPLTAEVVNRGPSKRASIADILRSRQVDRRDVITFTQQLSTLLAAGLPLDQAIDRLAEIRGRKQLGQILRALSNDVKSGRTLAGAMAPLRDAFPPFYVGMVGAGEATGTLPSVLGDIAEVMRSTQELRDRVLGSSLYPFVVLVLIAVSFVILMAWVVPEFRPLMEREGADVPLSASVVLLLSALVVKWGWLIALCLAGTALLAMRLAATGQLQRRVDHLLLRTPHIALVVRQLESAIYCRSLGTLLSHGVPLVEAVGIANEAVSNSEIKKALSSTKLSLSRGMGLAAALAVSGALPHMALQIVDAGEGSGNLHTMLLLAADTCQRDAQRTLERFVTLLAPVVTVALGVLVALIIGSILTAILSTYELPT